MNGTFFPPIEDPTLPPVVMPSCPIERRLKGQKALVTGASSGIGRGIAIGLGHAGADVIVNYIRDEDQAQAIVEEVKRCGDSRAHAYRADVSNEDEVQAMFAYLEAELGGIDILVNNAGLQQDALFDEMTLKQWNTVIGVNLTGQFLCAREAVRPVQAGPESSPAYPARPARSSVLSVHDVIPWAGHVNYAASKGGVLDDDEIDRAGGCALAYPRQWDQPGRFCSPINMEAWSTHEAYAALMSSMPYKRIGEVGRHCAARRWARLRRFRLYHRRDPLCRRRHVALSRLRDRRLNHSPALPLQLGHDIG